MKAFIDEHRDGYGVPIVRAHVNAARRRRRLRGGSRHKARRAVALADAQARAGCLMPAGDARRAFKRPVKCPWGSSHKLGRALALADALGATAEPAAFKRPVKCPWGSSNISSGAHLRLPTRKRAPGVRRNDITQPFPMVQDGGPTRACASASATARRALWREPQGHLTGRLNARRASPAGIKQPDALARRPGCGGRIRTSRATTEPRCDRGRRNNAGRRAGRARRC